MTSSPEFRSARLAGVVAAACLSVGAASAQAATPTSQVLSPYDQGTSSSQTIPPAKHKPVKKKSTPAPAPKTSSPAASSTKPASPAPEAKPTHLAFTGFDTRIPGAAGLLLIGAGGVIFWRRRSAGANSIS